MHDTAIDIIFSSSSGRAVRTAEIIRGDKNIEIVPCDNLREINVGEWEGQLHSDVEKQYPEEQRNFWHFPHLFKPMGGEGFSQVFSRTSREVESIISKCEGKNILIVTHAVVLKALIAYFENKDLKDLWSGAPMKATSLSMVEINQEGRSIVLQGDISHYKDIAQSGR